MTEPAVEPAAATAELAAESESAAESAVRRRSERRVACMAGCLHGFFVLVLTGLVCAGVLVLYLQHREEQYYDIPTVLKYLTGNQYTVMAHGFGPVDDNLFRTSYRYLLANTGADVMTNLALLNALNCELLPPDESNVRHSDFRTPEGIRRRFRMIRSLPTLLEFLDPAAGKGPALERLAGILGVAPSEIIAFGDEENDLDMLRFAGTGVAMGNASPILKDMADYVTLTNDEDGVAHALYRFFPPPGGGAPHLVRSRIPG